MFFWTRLRWRLRNGWRRAEMERDLQEEMRFHQEMLAQEEGEAARRLFGNATLLREESRISWGWARLEEFIQDMRFAGRGLRRDWTSTAAAAGALSLGIGFSIAVFTLVNAILLRPLPYREPERLVMIWAMNRAEGWDQEKISIPEMRAWQQSGLFEDVVGFMPNMTSVTGPGDPVFTHGYAVTPGFLRLLGVQPMLGRAFSAEEERKGGDKQRVLLRHSFWMNHFGGDREIAGKKILIEDRPYVVAGVMAPDFQFFNRQTDLYVPAPWDVNDETRRARSVRVIARLKQSLSLADAQTRATAMAERFAQEFPESNKGWTVRLTPVEQDTTGPVRPALWILLASGGMVLLIACSNVTNLLLAQGVARAREISLRMSLGAGRGRIVRQMLTESLLLALFCGGLGFLLAKLGVDYFQSTLPAQFSVTRFLIQMERIRIDAWVGIFAAGIVPLSAVLFGLMPAWRYSSGQLHDRLREGTRTMTSAARRLQAGLAAFEIALAVMLAVGAGLVARSFQQLYLEGPGFETRSLKSMFIALPWYELRTRDFGASQAYTRTLYERAMAGVAAAAGVEGVAAIAHLPLAGFYYLSSFVLEGQDHPRDQQPQAIDRYVSNGYHALLHVPLREGRYFAESDGPDRPRVAIVNDTFARRNWSGQSPVGKRLAYAARGREPEWVTVVGVVGSEHVGGMEEAPKPMIYFAMNQSPWAMFHLIVKSPQGLDGTVRTVTGALRGISPKIAPYEVRNLDDLVLDSTWRVRYSMMLLGAMAAVALLLAALGIYGVLSYAVRKRTREIGVRMALGAGRKEILGMIAGEGMRVGVAGIAAGLVGASLMSRFLETLLFGVRPMEPAVVIGVSLLLAGTVLAASLLPARRATELQPVAALREE